MKAAVLHEYKEPLQIEEVPTPAPGRDEVLIEVEACGVCHSDLHIANGDWPQLFKILKKPLILGHEVVGRVFAKGDAVSSLSVGERVGVPWIHWTCGACPYCIEGNENLCANQAITGGTVDGGFAQFMTAKATHALSVPGNLTFEEAAPLFCAGVTVYRAIKRAGVQAGQRVGVFGIGGLGHLAVQIAAVKGAQVIAVDVADDKLALARSLGAATSLNAADKDLRKKLRTIGGLHAAIVTSAARAAYDSAFSSLRRGGTLAVVGIPAEDLCFQPILMVGSETRIVASSVGTREDLRDILSLAGQGQVKCIVETRPLEQVNEVMNKMREGKLSARVVLAVNSARKE